MVIGGLAMAVGLAGCSATAPDKSADNSRSASPSPAPITAGQISTIQDGLKWAAGLPDMATPLELRAGAKAIEDLLPRDKIWFQTGNTIGQDLIKLNLATFNESSHSAENVAEMKRIAIEIQTAIDHGNKP